MDWKNFPDDISFKDWKKIQIENYNELILEFEKNGKIMEMKMSINGEDSLIETDPNFIEWCKN